MDVQDFQHEQVMMRHDEASGLTGIIALHSTRLGPAAGGVRRWRYDSVETALADALRLSEGMTLKNALAGIPFGGGKSVIVADHNARPTSEQLVRFAQWLNELEGRYVTAEDVGMGLAEMRALSAATPYVSGLGNDGIGGDPSPKTAYGVYLGLKAATQHKLGVEHLHGVRVAVQGLGSVGMALCHWLSRAGLSIRATDIDPERVRMAQEKYGVVGVTPDELLHADVDVFAPCALGGVITPELAGVLDVAVIAGAANNQLSAPESGEILAARGVLYAPDFVINAAGVISVAHEYLQQRGQFADVAGYSAEAWVGERTETIPHRLMNIIQCAAAEGCSTDVIARRKAMEIVHGGRGEGSTAAVAA